MEQKREYIKRIKNNFSIEIIKNLLDELKTLKILVVGDTIIDEYIFTLPKGRAIKDPILSLDFLRSEKYAGGILAIANHIANFAEKVDLITMLGDKNSKEEFVKNNINKNIKIKFFTKKNSPTTIKKRYIDYIRNGKLFKVEYINDKPINQELETEIIDFLKKELPKYDFVVIGDFGHGFINNNIIKIFEEYSKFIAANIQTNSSNMGFNYITKYNKLDYLTSNENEVRLALGNRFEGLLELIKKLKEKTNFRNILLTQGEDGCIYIKDSYNFAGPALTESIKDIVGAGDAVFAITCLLNYKDIPGELLIFIANSVGALAVNIMGNKESIKKENLIKFIEKLYTKNNL